LTVEELLSTLCVEFGIAYPPGNTSIKVFVDCINAYLLDAHARGRHTVLIIDEAQNLSAEVLEQMRLLTNLETDQRKLLQIILLGQPELALMLERPELRQLGQRIVARYHLGPLTKAEVAAYVRHRLEVAGAQRQLFPARLMGRLYRMSGGVPRVINVLCDRALLGAYVQSKERVDAATLAQAAREVLHQSAARRTLLRALAAGVILLVGAALALAVYWKEQGEPRSAALQPSIAAPVAAAIPATVMHLEAKPEAALPNVLEWPADEPLGDSRVLAYAALFRTWGADYQRGDACRQAEGLGLRCRTARGGLDELRELNRPAVLLLRDGQGREFHATLSALDHKTAGFALGAQTRTVAIGALALQWSGQYTLLWRVPPDAHENMRSGERGPAVAWLNRQLAQAQGRAAEPGKDPLFDQVLLRQLKQFQLAEGLIPDGVVGPRTRMRLAGVADKTAPKLSRKQGEK
jgi:general secretion pathway protein A